VYNLEGSTDLAILRAFAKGMNHVEATKVLERPFIHYVGNQPNEVRKHFHGLREAVPSLKGIAVFDHLENELLADLGAEGLMWQRREIENYFCYPEVLEAYANQTAGLEFAGPLFCEAETGSRLKAMRESIQEIETALRTLGKGSPWDANTKVSDDFLAPLFENYFKKLNLPNLMAKKNFYELAYFTPVDKLDPEIKEKLDAIVRIANSAKTAQEET
jgi:hypothetical protein